LPIGFAFHSRQQAPELLQRLSGVRNRCVQQVVRDEAALGRLPHRLQPGFHVKVQYLPSADGDVIEVLGHRFEVIDVPGHTAGHIAYLQRDEDRAPLLFCGDTLFSAGCGRLFEGTPAQMHQSLARLAALPHDTRVCCTHEYTLSNLRFATAVEPGNPAVRGHAERCQALRAAGQPTLPSSIGLELEINPFLRCGQPEVIAAARSQGAAGEDPVSVFTALREWKNRCR